MLDRLGSVVAGLFILGFFCLGQGGQAPEWFYWFVEHPSSPLVLSIGQPSGILVGDFNEDGNADLIIEAYRGPFTWKLGPDYGPAEVHVVMLLGDGQGGFGAPATVLKTKGSVYIELLADVNGDGHLDLVLSRQHITENPKTEIQALFGDGKGKLAPAVTLVEIDDILRNVIVGDVNGDGHLDFVVAHNILSVISVFIGDSKGRFEYHGGIQLGQKPDHLPYRLVLANFNRDGYLDLAIAGEVYEAHDRRTRFVAVFLGDGTGGFPHNSFFITLEPPEEEPPLWINLVAVDYNHDGHMDLITSRKGELILLLGRGDGMLEQDEHFWLPVADPRPWIAAVTDFNGDGCWDWVITLNSAPWFGLDIIVETCGAFAGRAFGWSAGTYVPGAVVADLNNDGYPDVVYATGHGRVGEEVTRLWCELNNMRREEGK